MDATLPAAPGLTDSTRIAVTRGEATREELAAVVVALDARARADAVDEPGASPAWLRAARIEATGGRRVAAPADLPRPLRPRDRA